MTIDLNIALDLGSDTLKVAYAFDVAQTGAVFYGKIARKLLPTEVAIPAIAHFDEQRRTWKFGYDVDKGNNASFATVVKIKSLLNLLAAVQSENGGRKQAVSIRARNMRFYREGKKFPKFYFPVSREMLADFNEMVDGKMTFDADDTPRRVCEMFFEYAAKLIKSRIRELEKKMRKDVAELQKKGSELVRNGLRGAGEAEFSDNMKIAVVYPSGASKDYQTELSRLTEKAFGIAPDKSLSSTRALSIYAKYRKVISDGDSALVFDLGETDISVTRANVETDGELVIDGADGHSAPCKVGGNDVDRAVADFMEGTISDRETVGTPSSGQLGHIVERGLREKQYLFMKDIKKAKILHSMPESKDIFPEGVPVNMVRDLRIQRKLTREDFVASIGITQRVQGVAKEIADYIINELSLQINSDVHKIIISGGLAETYGLLQYIDAALKKAFAKKIEIITFDDEKTDKDGFTIASYEDSTYAAAVGAAIVAMDDIEVKTRLSLSYATWFYPRHNRNSQEERDMFGHKVLAWIADKGQVIKEGEALTTKGNVGLENEDSTVTKEDEIFSLPISKQQLDYLAQNDPVLKKQSFKRYNEWNVFLEHSKNQAIAAARRKHLVERAGLKVVSGGRDSLIYYYYKGTRVKLIHSQVAYEEGVRVDKDGCATPIIGNMEKASERKKVRIAKLISESPEIWGKTEEVLATDIELKFVGMEDFDISGE